jgi:hypothetical protein
MVIPEQERLLTSLAHPGGTEAVDEDSLVIVGDEPSRNQARFDLSTAQTAARNPHRTRVGSLTLASRDVLLAKIAPGACTLGC